MEKPRIELKSIKVHLGLSEETPAYTASVFVDGEHFANVSNEGHGGADRVEPTAKHSAPGQIAVFYEELKKLEERIAATYPKDEFDAGDEVMTLEESLEGLCHALVWEHVDQRNFRSTLSRSVIVREGDRLFKLKGRKSVSLVNAAEAKYGKENVLNSIKFSEAWAIAKAAA